MPPRSGKASWEVLGEMLEAGTHWLSVGGQKAGGKRFTLCSGCCSFVWVLLAALVALELRCRRPFRSSFSAVGPSLVLSSGLGFFIVSRDTATTPRIGLWQVSPLCYDNGIGLWL